MIDENKPVEIKIINTTEYNNSDVAGGNLHCLIKIQN